MLNKNTVYFLKKINYYIYQHKNIKHPFALHPSCIIIKTHNKLESIDRFDIDLNNVDETVDISDIYYMDKLL